MMAYATRKVQLGCSFFLVIGETLIKVSITNYDDQFRLIAALGAVGFTQH
jgi:hypothetical protein